MGSRYELRDETEDRELIGCTGRAADYFLALMDDAEQDFTLVSRCSFHGYSSDPVSEQTAYYSAATVISELDAVINELAPRDREETLHDLSTQDWIDWFGRARDHAKAHPEHRYTAAFYV